MHVSCVRVRVHISNNIQSLFEDLGLVKLLNMLPVQIAVAAVHLQLTAHLSQSQAQSIANTGNRSTAWLCPELEWLSDKDACPQPWHRGEGRCTLPSILEGALELQRDDDDIPDPAAGPGPSSLAARKSAGASSIFHRP